jgi:hypothetical protein
MVAPHEVGRIAPAMECVGRRHECVGPRPEVPEYVAMYDEEMLKALEVRPGLNGSREHRGI